MRHRIIAFSLLSLLGCSRTALDLTETGSGGASGGPGAGGGGAGGEGGDGGPGGTPSLCDQVASDFPIHRLSAIQYRNTLRDLFTRLLGTGVAADVVMASLTAPLGKIPPDVRREINPYQKSTTYSRFDQDVSQDLIESSYDTAVAAGALLTQPARLGTVVGACATDGVAGNDDSCLDAFIDRMGALALRRPLNALEKIFFKVEVYESPSSANPAGYADVIAEMLLAPQFLYHVEHGAEPAAGLAGTYELSAYELANRLSYDLWDTMPDVALSQAAASGAILTPDGFAAQVDRLLADPRARTTFGTFFREWLRSDSLGDLTANVGNAAFRNLAGKNLPTAALRDAMIREVSDFTAYHMFDTPGTVKDLLTSDLSTARSRELADIYGVPVWDGAGEPPHFPTGQRPGLLTRAAFLATGKVETSPIDKGLLIREAILCGVVPPDPPSFSSPMPVITPDMTTRQKVEATTQQNPGCVACHSYFDPLGFATENYDSLGRLRSEQILFDGSGAEIGRAPIDTKTIPMITDDDTPIDGPAELMDRILESGKAEACLTRQVFRYTFLVTEDLTRDGCALQQMYDTLKAGGPIRRMLRASTLTRNFRQRVIP